MPDTSKWEVNIPWIILKKHLQESIYALYSELEKTTDVETYRLQGEIRRLKKLLNLPGTLSVLYDKGETR